MNYLSPKIPLPKEGWRKENSGWGGLAGGGGGGVNLLRLLTVDCWNSKLRLACRSLLLLQLDDEL